MGQHDDCNDDQW